MKKYFIVFMAIGSVFLGFSCNNDTSLTGAATSNKPAVETPKNEIPTEKGGDLQPQSTPQMTQSTPKPGGPVQVSLNLTCSQAANTQNNPQIIKRKAGQEVELTLSSELCVEVVNDLTILFVVDWSNSMTTTDPVNLLWNCGRYGAAKAIMDYVASQKQANDNIKVGFIGFSDRAWDTIMLSYNAFLLTYLNRFKFCNAKAINGTEGGTNYYAAFSQAETTLRSITSGSKIMYFISDGGPTVRKDGSADFTGSNKSNYDQIAAQDGIAAAGSLRKNTNNLIINGLLLGNEGAAAKQVLVDAIGSADYVRTSGDASQMAAEILKFPEVAINQNSLVIKLQTNAPSSSEDVAAKSFSKKTSVRNTWDYHVGPISLTDKVKGDGIRNFVILAKDINNKNYSSQISLKVVTEP